MTSELSKDYFLKDNLYILSPTSKQQAVDLQIFLNKEIGSNFLEKETIPNESLAVHEDGTIRHMGLLWINDEWLMMNSKDIAVVKDALTKLTNKTTYIEVPKELFNSLGLSSIVEATKGVLKEEDIKSVNEVLNSKGLPNINLVVQELLKEVKEAKDNLKVSEDKFLKVQPDLKAFSKLKKDIASEGSHFGKPKEEVSLISKDSKIPQGKVVFKKAKDVFNIKGKDKELFDFDIPTFEWDSPHPHVPIPTEGYIFRHNYLMQLLHALKNNKKAWLAGHTGTGKSTLVKEVCSRLGWPFMRINFDSEISRMDLIGRDILTTEGGTTVSKFVEGILPTTMVGPYVLLCDEMDFIKADVAYVLQRALEDEGLLLTEDGGRYVHPHDMFRIIATGNTNGQGDDSGIYQGSRPQSMAFLDRFTIWMDVKYLSKDDERKLLKDYVPTISEDQTNGILKYVEEHRNAFEKGEVIQPLSPRGITSLGEAIVTFSAYMLPEGEDGTTEKGKKSIARGLKLAVDTTLLNRASPQDRSVLNGIADRVFKDLAA